MPSLKLSYFDFAGRAEIVRTTLRLGGVAFVDDRLTFQQVGDRKATLPYGRLPVLNIDGRIVAENQGILRYAAGLAGMYPPATDPVAALLVDEVLDTFEDFVERLIAPSFHEQDPAKVKALRLELLSGKLPKALALMDCRLEQIAAYPRFRADPAKLYVHELVVWENVVNFRSGMLQHIPVEFIDKYETMVAIHDKVASRAMLPSPSSALIPATETGLEPPTKLKLVYFDAKRRAGHIRLALCIGGVAFEDERVSSTEFRERKLLLLPNGQLPVIEINDGAVVSAQSMAILRFAGRLSGLYPFDDPIQALQIDEVIGHLDELDVKLDPLFNEQDPERKHALGEDLAKSTIPEFLGSLDRRLAQWKAAHCSPSSVFALGGDQLTLADVLIHHTVEQLTNDHIPMTIISEYPHLLQSSNAVASHPRVLALYGA